VLEDPGLDPVKLAGALQVAYGIDATALSFVPGYDLQAASYEVVTPNGSFFLKVRFGAVQEASLDVPRALLEAGIRNVLAPLRTTSSALRTSMGSSSLTLQPFVRGRNAMVAGLTDDQWRTLGATLRAVHDSGLERSFADRLPVETFLLAAATPVRRVLEVAKGRTFESPAARQLAAFWLEQAERIEPCSSARRSWARGCGLGSSSACSATPISTRRTSWSGTTAAYSWRTGTAR